MLTKNDLMRIDKIVKGRIDESNNSLRKQLKREIRLSSKKLENKLIKKMNTISNSLDRDIVDHEKRIKHIEHHLQITAN